jgi:PKHD-type hydroxylase
MYLILENVLDAATLDGVRTALSTARFAEGTSTAGWYARGVKNNLQTTSDAWAQKVHQALFKHRNFRAAALPNVILPPTFSRYVPGMGYGSHVDEAIMGAPDAMRTDIALTLFLSDPSTYDGGELVVESYTGRTSFKLPAGHAILYPATSIHHVAPLTRGERLAAVLWIQSLVRDAGKREILYDLDTLRKSLWQSSGQVKTPESDIAARSYANLLRMWSEP